MIVSESRPACRTVYLGPTDHRGARVKATHLNTKRSVTLSWDHALGPDENHERAALAVLFTDPGALDAFPPISTRIYRCSVDGGGWVWMAV